jgi:hypothetical protein
MKNNSCPPNLELAPSHGPNNPIDPIPTKYEIQKKTTGYGPLFLNIIGQYVSVSNQSVLYFLAALGIP